MQLARPWSLWECATAHAALACHNNITFVLTRRWRGRWPCARSRCIALPGQIGSQVRAGEGEPGEGAYTKGTRNVDSRRACPRQPTPCRPDLLLASPATAAVAPRYCGHTVVARLLQLADARQGAGDGVRLAEAVHLGERRRHGVETCVCVRGGTRRGVSDVVLTRRAPPAGVG